MLRVRTALTGWPGAPGLMTQYFAGVAASDAAATRAAGYVQDVVIPTIRSKQPDGLDYQVSNLVDVLDATDGSITDTISVAALSAVTGAGGASMAPPAVAALVHLNTSTFLGGRRVRGRTFVSPLADAAVTTDGVLGGSAQSELEALGASMLAALTAGDTWVVWHRPKGASPGYAAPITSTSVPFKLAVLTSRRD